MAVCSFRPLAELAIELLETEVCQSVRMGRVEIPVVTPSDSWVRIPPPPP